VPQDHDSTQTIILAVLGMGWLSFIATALGWWREKSVHQQEVRKYLMEARRTFNATPDLLAVVGVLKEERRSKASGGPLPEPLMAGKELRKLPEFLEPLGPYLLLDRRTPKDAYEIFAEEILLCHHSKLLWADEKEPYSDTWWSGFKQLANETQRRVGKRHSTA
jgi:hypothetical protein